MDELEILLGLPCSKEVLGMCYIIFTSSFTYFFYWVCVKFFCLRKRVTYLGGFSAHGFFADGFLFPVKELGFLTNPSHWVRVLDATSSYMYIVL
jgi:hypothetical protein